MLRKRQTVRISRFLALFSACPELVEGPFFLLPLEAGRPPSTDLSVAQDRLRQAQGERQRGTRSFAYSFHVTFAVSSLPSFAAVPPASSSTAETSPPLPPGSSAAGLVLSEMRRPEEQSGGKY